MPKSQSLLLASMLVVSHVGAQNYPTKPVRIVVPFPAGGTSDILAPAVGQKLADETKQLRLRRCSRSTTRCR